jgi:hypothetical protein
VGRKHRAFRKLGIKHQALGTAGRCGEAATKELEVRGLKSEVRRRRAAKACQRFVVNLNIEQQNKEPQNDEVNASLFPSEADSIFCGSKSFLR